MRKNSGRSDINKLKHSDKNGLCAISTSWRAEVVQSTEELIDIIKKTGMNMLELEFRISSEAFEEIKKKREGWGLKITSLHAVCPSTPGRGKKAERFFICDTDEEKRKKGVEDVKSTLRNAAEIGARAVVVHCGRVPMEDPFYKIIDLYGKGKLGTTEAQVTLHEMMVERMMKSKKSFQAVLKSLDELNSVAEKLGVKVGVENRYYYGEFPNAEELDSIFGHFKGSSIGYWHDTGHAHVMEVLYGFKQKKLLEAFAGYIIGIHLHDVKEGYTDHNEPGSGNVDFDMIKPFLKPDTLRIMELNRRVDLDGAKRGIAFLRKKGIFPH